MSWTIIQSKVFVCILICLNAIIVNLLTLDGVSFAPPETSSINPGGHQHLTAERSASRNIDGGDAIYKTYIGWQPADHLQNRLTGDRPTTQSHVAASD